MMSENKKVSLTTLGPKKVQKKEAKKEDKKKKVTVRLSLTLAEPNKKGCSMFDYEALIKKEKDKAENSKKKEVVNGNNPFPDMDEDVAKMAKHFEDKYNDRRYTYAELGAGYDESDSFIDNTDICEEELTNDEFKRYQGFYINKEKFDSGSETEKKTKRRRRSVKSHSESDSTSESRSKKKYKSDKTKPKKPRTNGNKIVSESSMSRSSSTSSDSESERSRKA